MEQETALYGARSGSVWSKKRSIGIWFFGVVVSYSVSFLGQGVRKGQHLFLEQQRRATAMSDSEVFFSENHLKGCVARQNDDWC